MKISEILTEEEVHRYEVQEISFIKDRVLPILQTQCNEFLAKNKNRPLYRGSRTGYNDISIIDTTNSLRRSQNTSNYYTEILSNSPYMKDYPKRNQSLICSTRHETARYFGKRGNWYCLLPFNGIKIGVVPDPDIWDIHLPDNDYGISKIVQMNHLLRSLGFYDSTFKELLDHSKTEEFTNQFRKRYPNLPPEEFIPDILKLLSPESLGFELYDTKTFDNSKYYDNECWFSGKCLAIRTTVYENVMSLL